MKFDIEQKVTTMASIIRAVAGILFIALTAAPASAHEYKVGQLVIGHPWSRETPGGAKIGGGYLTVTNNGSDTERLLGGSIEVADHIEIHEMKMDGAVMQMRPLPDGVEIKPGETIKLEPGGYHMMFMDLKQPLKKGDMIKAALQFQKAGKVEVEFKVESLGAASPSTSGHNH